jgi:shikimate kinase
MSELPGSVWLVGLPAAGKSTVGPQLAERMGYDFVDLDVVVEDLAQMTVPEIFREGGEAGFREAEARASDSLLERRHIVVATGGGWMGRDDIQRGPVGCVRVWLRVSPVAAIERLGSQRDIRPLLSGESGASVLARLLADRERAYGEAELVVDTTGRTPAEVADIIVQRVSEILGKNSPDGVRRLT